MCYLIAKEHDGHGCYALKTKHGQHLVEMKRELYEAVGLKGIQIITISRPMAFHEYALYHFIDNEEFVSIVKAMRP